MKRKRLFKNIFRYLGLSLTGAVLGFGLFTSFSTVAQNELPMPFGIGSFVVMSGSMEPDISVGDLILVAKTGDYEQGDDIIFQSGASRVVHRIKRIDGDRYVTWGIANDSPDDPITEDLIYGEVILVIPVVGTLVTFIKNPLVLLCLGALVLILIESSIKGERDEKRAELAKIRESIDALKDEIKDKNDEE